ncbi:hypothetical protein NSED_03300 [Candidatus Nitrosopumilus sediminis]|uniref:Uncharacterized protein n=1 Tax=Candidatus Nitrosopumilus sediminis TaxID=1229909 RepID=K0BDR4_9ARCH|nr:hypothetical protein NSED_03300 [Candidatus Nitrosopumilus sediminis]
MVTSAIGITDSNLFLEITIFNPINSATMKIRAKKYPPLPSFQLQAMESGNAIIEKRIGLEMIRIPKIKFQFCIKLDLKEANKYLDFIYLKIHQSAIEIKF